MGEARRRGTYEERKVVAVTRNKKVAKHYGLKLKELTRRQITNISNNFHRLTRAQRKEVLRPKK